MAGGDQELVYGPKFHIDTYPDPVPCQECGGGGKAALLVTTRACDACEGSGRVWPEPKHEHVPPKLGYWRCERTFDNLGRVMTESQWFEPVANADSGPNGADQSEASEKEVRRDDWGGNPLRPRRPVYAVVKNDEKIGVCQAKAVASAPRGYYHHCGFFPSNEGFYIPRSGRSACIVPESAIRQPYFKRRESVDGPCDVRFWGVERSPSANLGVASEGEKSRTWSCR